MSLDEQAKAVVTALRRRPALLYRVQSLLRRQRPVVSRWTPDPDSHRDWFRYHPDGHRVARAFTRAGNSGWSYVIWGDAGTSVAHGDDLSSAREAMDTCDKALEGFGFLFADGEPPRSCGPWQESGPTDEVAQDRGRRVTASGKIAGWVLWHDPEVLGGDTPYIGIVQVGGPSRQVGQVGSLEEARDLVDAELRRLGYELE